VLLIALPLTAGADRGVRSADCGLRTQIRSNSWIGGLTANGFFLFRGRDVAVNILHAVRSAITAIAELLVIFDIMICILLCASEKKL